MKLTFIELTFFEKYRADYLNDEEYRALQSRLLDNPTVGDVIQGTGGLRKIRIADNRRHKGKRGGARVIYYHYVAEERIYFLTIYGKDVKDDLTQQERDILAEMARAIKGK